MEIKALWQNLETNRITYDDSSPQLHVCGKEANVSVHYSYCVEQVKKTPRSEKVQKPADFLPGEIICPGPSSAFK